MLPIKNRLSNKVDFQKVYKSGRFFSTNGLAIRFISNSLEVSRIGFSVGKSFSKKAVTRNRVRRLLREVLHQKIGQLSPEVDMVVMYSSRIKDPTYKELTLALEHVLKKARLLKNDAVATPKTLS